MNFDVVLSEELDRLLHGSSLTEDEQALARTIVELVAAGGVQSSADMPQLVETVKVRHGADAPMESLLSKAFDMIALEEEFF